MVLSSPIFVVNPQPAWVLDPSLFKDAQSRSPLYGKLATITQSEEEEEEEEEDEEEEAGEEEEAEAEEEEEEEGAD